LFLHQPKCSVQSGNGIIKALGEHYNFKIFSKNEVEYNFFDDVDMIAVPGGFGDASSYDQAFKHNKKRIKQFVKNGGRYLGICMGAYWAGSHYFNILDDVDAVQYIKRPRTDTKRTTRKKHKGTLAWNTYQHVFLLMAALLMVITVSLILLLSMQMVIQWPYTKERMGLIGCHPESEQFWYDSYSWMKGKYHDGYHHHLLLEFVNELMERE